MRLYAHNGRTEKSAQKIAQYCSERDPVPASCVEEIADEHSEQRSDRSDKDGG